MHIASQSLLEKTTAKMGSVWTVLVRRRQHPTMELPGLLSPNTREGESPWRFTVFDPGHTRGFGHVELMEKRLDQEVAPRIEAMLAAEIKDIAAVEVRSPTLAHFMEARPVRAAASVEV